MNMFEPLAIVSPTTKLVVVGTDAAVFPEAVIQ